MRTSTMYPGPPGSAPSGSAGGCPGGMRAPGGIACRREPARPVSGTGIAAAECGRGEPAYPMRERAVSPDLPPCPHRYYSPGFATVWGNIPSRAVGAYFPGDEPGFRCALSLEMCSEHPPDCPEWKEAEEGVVCPACIEYGQRQAENPFRETRLLTHDGRYYCPGCYESYASADDLAAAATKALREALDDGDYLEEVIRGLEREFGASRHG